MVNNSIKVNDTECSIILDKILVEREEVWNHKDGKRINENVDELKRAISDVIEIFEQEYGFNDVKKKTILVYYSEPNPVYLYGGFEIGVHRTENSYEQDVYQFSHELMHLVLSGVFGDKYKWLEESICMLSSIVTLQLLYKKYFISDPCRSHKLRNFEISNSREIYPSIPKECLNAEDRRAQNTVAMYLIPFVMDHLRIFSLLLKIEARNIDFDECIEKWSNLISGEDDVIYKVLSFIYHEVVMH